MNLVTPDQLKLETFSPWLKSKFRVAIDSANYIEVELAEANVLTYPVQPQSAAKGPMLDSFSLVFHGPENHFLPQRVYPFEHDQIGRFELFIVPTGQKPGFIQYQAIFNRLLRAV
jgi:hypothetical protein